LIIHVNHDSSEHLDLVGDDNCSDLVDCYSSNQWCLDELEFRFIVGQVVHTFLVVLVIWVTDDHK